MSVTMKKFKISDFFTIENVRGINKNKLTKPSDDEKFDYVTRTARNNGIESVTGLVPDCDYNEANTISLGLLQMTFFLRDKPWYGGQFLRKITPKQDFNREQMLYFLGVMRPLGRLFSSVLVRHVNDLFNKAEVELPVTSTGQPDFDYMTEFIKELEAERIKELEAERIRELKAYLQVTGLDNTTFSSSTDGKSTLGSLSDWGGI